MNSSEAAMKVLQPTDNYFESGSIARNWQSCANA
jgi:hypothetical protein